ncbi:efflux transporter outer membrane subunit [Aromatoleum sp.]|uniref:efflux transporter outer membrane subunit n=1 Tax=Aromatoleum sp. TaxID=2307007 RepID=UPI002FC819BF
MCKPTSRRANLLLAALSVAVLSACASMAPDYQRPALPVPDRFAADAAATTARPAREIGWRGFFTDPQLREVIDAALGNNRDLRIAVLNIERARGLYGIREADVLPTISAGASGTAQHIPETLSVNDRAGVSRQYSVALGVSAYELDLFGRVRSLRDAALQEYLASEDARRATQIGLVAEVARAYLQLAADQRRLELAQATLVSQRSSYELIRRRFELGVSSDLDLRQAQTTVDAARADVARFTGFVTADRNALALLAGIPMREAWQPGDVLVAPTLAELPAGLPSDVLLRRPDVVQAERQLQAANANIGAARAAFYPRISLTASAGTASASLSELFSGGSGTWAFIPQISLPIFDHGRNRSGLQVAEAERDIGVAEYEQAIQVAFREVSDALGFRTTLADQLQAQTDLVGASEQVHRLSEARYESGVDDYLGVLDAQRALYAARQGRIAAELEQQLNLVTLYRALGGGLDAGTPEQATVVGALGREAR